MIDFSPYAAVLLDLDGTLCEANDILPGAAELVARLRDERRTFAVLSNSTDSPQQVTRRLARMGVTMEPERIFTAAAAAAEFVLRCAGASRPRVFNLATEGIHELLEGHVDWVKHRDEPCDAVIAGAIINVYSTEERQRIALDLLRAGARLVGICADRVFPSPRGLEFGTGAFTLMLGYAANTTPTFCGKPERIFFEELCERLKVEPSQCILIGDNLEADIGGAKAMGMATVLTLSGITRGSDLQHLPPERTPDRVVGDLRDV